MESPEYDGVPRADTSKYISSFRLQNLRPDTVYSVQVRCKHSDHGVGYWSDWSNNSTRRTHEDRPSSKPDLWMNVIQSKTNERQVQILCKDPEFSNGKILRFDFKVQNQADRSGNGTDWESFPVNGSGDDDGSGDDPRNSVLLKTLVLSDKQSIKVRVIAVNSVGASPEAFLVLTAKSNDPSPVQNLQVHHQDGRLWLDFKPRNNNTFPSSEYVMEWTDGGNVDWQREKKNTHRAAIKGDLQPFVCYNVSVYPVYSGRVGKPTRTEAFLEQGAPSLGPSVRLKGNARHDSAELEWEEIPLQNRRGFITNYTVSYRAGNRETNHVTVPANTTSYTMTGLHHDTRYDVWIRASTIGGSKDGNSHSFTTLKYGPGMIESIIVAVSLGFFMFFLLCLYKRDQIRENFWPQIPNPGESTIGNWSPDCSTKEESEKESCVSGISVLDVCESKPGPEEDKASLSLKKDKYLSEENSSGIGGSSCMSSPRQSVSDSDEADAADTSASTVQYSSVVAPRGYKGQTPGSHGSHGSQTQPGVFWRSESTQPLLDSEENPDMSVQDSRLFQRSPGSSCFTPGDGEEQPEWEQQDLCSVEENGETTAVPDRLTDVLPAGAPGAPGAPASSYMPQLGGYRPQ
ncbi:interleukin-6 receptor subunit beta-like [Cololabis saira]|uniref:interleukin-6 receptor subunit beta-like n=1 Tax=Cololabis saira TaxID=129043 RepID=UPI002AD3A43E|nr:interleukin-6 receptor subunit beta-like [Cololabis saira]